jgi:hypothetical protein
MFRLIIRSSVITGLIIGGTFALYVYDHNSQTQQIEKLTEQKQQLEQFIDRLQADRRLAKILVRDQKIVNGKLQNTLLFVEYRPDGSAMDTREFVITGEETHIDAQVVKFKDQYVKDNDALRGKSIMLFVRIYGADQAPSEGLAIDSPGQIPDIYRGTDAQVSKFDQDLWAKFWDLYNDQSAREARGIRGLHGEGLYGRFEPGHVYTITIRPDGDGTLTEEPMDPIYQQALKHQ